MTQFGEDFVWNLISELLKKNSCQILEVSEKEEETLIKIYFKENPTEKKDSSYVCRVQPIVDL